MKSAELVVANPATYVTLGDMTSAGVLLSILGFFAIASLDALGVPGAILDRNSSRHSRLHSDGRQCVRRHSLGAAFRSPDVHEA